MDPGRCERILVWLPNWIGDVVMATPALRALRGRFGQARTTFVGRPAALAVLAGSDWADETIADTTAGWNLLSWAGLALRLRRERFDLAVLLPNSFRTAAIASMGGAARIAGYDRDGRGWILSKDARLAPPRDAAGQFLPTPAIEYYARLAEALGAACADRRMTLPLRPQDASAADEELRRAGADPARPIVLLNPGASFGPSKMWPADRYAALADALIEKHGAQIVVNAAPSERAVAAAVVGAMNHKPLLHFADRDNSLGLLKGLLARTDLLVTNDTGARHVGVALGCGVVTIFGSTNPDWTRLDYPRERIIRTNVRCGPCQKKHCRLPAGPEFHRCMTAVTVDMVLAAAEELLRERPAHLECGRRGDRFGCRPQPTVRRGPMISLVGDDRPLLDLLKHHGLDGLDAVLSLPAGQDLDKPGLGARRRTRLELADASGRTHVVYLKRYGAQGRLARLRRRWEAGRWCSPGESEFLSVRAARQAGVTAMREIAWGAEPRGGRSYVFLSEAPGEALERCASAFWDRVTGDEPAGAALAADLAGLVLRLHSAGWVHRDLYASHVFVREQPGRLELGLIDLARMFRPRWRRFRWRVKDLSALHYSLPQAWVSRWWGDFLRAYAGPASPAVLARWRRAVEQKSCRIARRARRRL